MFVDDFAQMNEGSEFVRFRIVFSLPHGLSRNLRESLRARLAATNPILYRRTFPEESLGFYRAIPFQY